MLGAVTALATFGIAILLAPVHQTLVGRFAYVSVIAALFLSFSYVVPYSGSLPRLSIVTTALAVAAAAGAALARRAEHPILPKVGVPELATGLFALVTAVWLRPLLQFGTTVEAVARLARRGDQAGHFTIIEVLRIHQAEPYVVSASYPSPFHLLNYPAGYHAIVASIMEAMIGPWTDANLEPLAYSSALAVVVALSWLALFAAVVAQPVVAHSKVMTLAVLVTLGVFWFGTRSGAGLAAQGWGNFILGCCLGGILALVCTRLGRQQSWVDLTLLAAGMVLLVNTWTPLVACPAIASIVVMGRLLIQRHVARALTLALACLIALALSVGDLWRTAMVHKTEPFYLIQGSVTSDEPWIALAIIGVLVVVQVMLLVHSGRGATERFQVILRLAYAAPAVMILTFFGVEQIRHTGGVFYYWHKMAIFLMLVSIVLIVDSLAESVPRNAHRILVVAILVGILAAAVLSRGPGLYARGVWTTPANSEERRTAANVVATVPLLAKQPGPVIFLDVESLNRLNASLEDLDAALHAAQWGLGMADKDYFVSYDAMRASYQLREPAINVARMLAKDYPGVVVVMAAGETADLFDSVGLRVIRV